MDPTIARGLSILIPALIILLYGILKCRGRTISFPIFGGVAAGMGCAVCALGLELGANYGLAILTPGPELRAILVAFGVAAPIEEGLKLVAVLALAEFTGPRPMQRILLSALAIGVGFAVFENYLYIYHAPDAAKIGLALLRGSTAVPAHGMFALVMGSLVVSAAIYPDGRGGLLLLAFLVPWGLHGLYDLFALSPISTGLPQQMRWVLGIGALFAIRYFNRVLHWARSEDGNLGHVWRPVPRVRLFAIGSIGLLWPTVLVLAAARAPAVAAVLPLLGVLPGTMAGDLLRSAFRSERTPLLH
jgi:RsiW-degrading membrane proteinase PrsW (M82 family)